MEEYSIRVHPFFIRQLTTEASSSSPGRVLHGGRVEGLKEMGRHNRRWRNGEMEEERKKNMEVWEECARKWAKTERRWRVRRWKAERAREGEYYCDWIFFIFCKLFFFAESNFVYWNFSSWCDAQVALWAFPVIHSPSPVVFLSPHSYIYSPHLHLSDITCFFTFSLF